MRLFFTRVCPVIFAGWLALALAGCGMSPGSTGTSGTGADGGPWPTGPNRSVPQNGRPSATEPPKAPLTVLIKGIAAENEEMRLDITKVDLNYNGNLAPVTTAQDISKNETLPLKFGDKGGVALLARILIPRRAYSVLHLQMGTGKTTLVRDNTPVPLTFVSTNVELPEWTLDDTKPNVLIVTVDGTKATRKEGSAVLPANALSVQTSVASGGISGKLNPPVANSRVKVYWGNNKEPYNTAIPDLQAGAFTVNNLPPGNYRIEVDSPDHQLQEPLKDPVAVEDKMVTLKPFELTTTGH